MENRIELRELKTVKRGGAVSNTSLNSISLPFLSAQLLDEEVHDGANQNQSFLYLLEQVYTITSPLVHPGLTQTARFPLV